MEKASSTTQKSIVVAQRGFVFIGDVRTEGDQVVIENALNIRRWGTKTGLGQLAMEGKQPNTLLDPCGTVTIHQLAVVCQYKADPEKWQN